ncbi:MAG TPA: EamA family transporter [Candidatus Dormibacteraeota bacterium]|nr:EamA family transporter [Candidatus Dormibacteraeota bacterium]
MIAILGGLGAAICWSASTLCGARASRAMGSAPVLAWIMLVGLLVAIPAVLISGAPSELTPATIFWLAAAGVGNVVGLLLEYVAFRYGKVGIVAAIASAEGAVAAAIAVLAGESVAPLVGLALAMVAVGVALAALTPNLPGSYAPRPRLAAACAVVAALLFGLTLYSLSRISAELPLAWTILPARLLGVVAVAAPLAATRRLPWPSTNAPLVVVAGLGEVVGILLYGAGSRQDVAVAAVLASQFAAIVAVLGWLLMGERLSRLQVGGVCTVIVGVAWLAVLRA